MRGEHVSQCYNPEVSGKWIKSDVSHKKTFSLDDSTMKKKIAKEKRKKSAETKAAALLSQCSELRLHPEEAGNPTAAEAAIAAIAFELEETAFELGESQSTPTQASSSSGNQGEETEKNRAFVTLYNRMDSKESEEFKWMYDLHESSESDED
jgi:hypothetical protein